MKIGFFDSGIGGLAILRQVMVTMPEHSYVYYADNANNPYGKKSSDEIFQLTTNSIDFLFKKDCELVVLACNSATTVLPRIQQEWLPKFYPGRRVLGVIRPTAEHIIETSFANNFLIATSATVSANSYIRELHKLGSTKPLIQVACPDLAAEIELHLSAESNSIDVLLHDYLTQIPNTPDTAIFSGCTHYEFVAKKIMRLRDQVTFVSQADIVAKSLQKYLLKYQAFSSGQGHDTEFFASAGGEKYIGLLSIIAEVS